MKGKRGEEKLYNHEVPPQRLRLTCYTINSFLYVRRLTIVVLHASGYH